MALYVSVILSVLLFAGCSTNIPQKKEIDIQSEASKEIGFFKESEGQKKGTVPQIVLPNVYEEVSVFDEKRISFSAQDASLHSVLYSMAELSGLNLIIDKDVDVTTPVTLSIKDAPLKEALDMLMHIAQTYYVLKSNMLHVKQFEQKSFFIPYVSSTTSYSTELGGDMLSSATSGSTSGSSSGSGVKGEFKLKFDNPQENNNFYEQLEQNIRSLMSEKGKYTLNRFSGVLNVYDKKNNVDAIEDIIKRIKKQSNKQVLIEAKILEVILNDNHSLGVNWDAVSNSVFQTGDQLNLSQTLGLGGAVAGTMSYTTKSFSAVIDALDESGDIDTLSNPSINVLSGQSAIISSGKLIPFWEKEIQTTSSTATSDTQVTYERRDVLDGMTMGVTPTVMEDGGIMLNIIPITSSIEEIVNYTDENGISVATAPVLNIKEAGSVIYAQDNDLVLIGGLINNTVSKERQSVPLLGSIPFAGALFNKVVDKKEKRELVILIRVKIIGS